MAKFLEEGKKPLLSDRYTQALHHAFYWHDLQVRKGILEVHYFSHLLSTSALVLKAGGDEDEAIAALLHDTIEDVGVNFDQISGFFGDNVALIVQSLSEKKELPKHECNAEYVERIRHHSLSAIRVLVADKLDNIRDYYSFNSHLFGEDQRKFYHEILYQLAYKDGIPDAVENQITEIGEILDAI
jgi:(p)ppGpp synthase/HD superfamily hydrolase